MVGNGIGEGERSIAPNFGRRRGRDRQPKTPRRRATVVDVELGGRALGMEGGEKVSSSLLVLLLLLFSFPPKSPPLLFSRLSTLPSSPRLNGGGKRTAATSCYPTFT